MAACTTFTACNSDESSLPTAGNQLQLSFGINAPQSRAIFTDTKLPDGKPVGVRLSGYADYANLVYTSTTSGSKQTWTSTTSVTLTDTKGTLYAYWPQNNAVSIDAINVDMTAADQTDWLYATPVADVNKNKASVAVTMNHAAANINVKVNKGSYKGAGAISNITLQSDGIALGGTFNAAKATPAYESFEDEGKPLSRTVSTTAGGTATDIMVVPSGKSAAITFLLTIDGIKFTAKSDAVQLVMGNSYQYTLNLSDISTYMEISGFSVKQWTTVTGGALDLTQKLDLNWNNAPNGVYAVTANGQLVMPDIADKNCIAVALIVNDAPVPQKLMIEKYEGMNSSYNKRDKYYHHSLYGDNINGVKHYDTADGINSEVLIYKNNHALLADYKTWTAGALSDFDGLSSTRALEIYSVANYSDEYNSWGNKMEFAGCLSYNFNLSDRHNLGYDDWYIPTMGQLGLVGIYFNEINDVLTKINGAVMRGSQSYISCNYKIGGTQYGLDNSTWVLYTYSSDNITVALKAEDCVRLVRDWNGVLPTVDNNYYNSNILFYIYDRNYKYLMEASSNMTWEQWIYSSYNVDGYKIDDYTHTKIVDKNFKVEISGILLSDKVEPKSYELVTINGEDLGLMSFTISGKTYYAEEGMTWEQWVNSNLNWLSCLISGTTVCTSGGSFIQDVVTTDIIIDGGTYNTYVPSGGGREPGPF